MEGADAKVLLRYPASHVLASGWLLGENHYAGKPALLSVRAGQGTVYLFGMRPQYRGQSYLTLKILFNALLAGARVLESETAPSKTLSKLLDLPDRSTASASLFASRRPVVTPFGHRSRR